MTKPKRGSSKATAARKAAPAPRPAFVVHGTDEHGKPRAARFPGDQQDLANKAAALMHLQFCRAMSPAVEEIAQKLPAGRIYSNGRGFVPYVRRDLYAKLLDALAGRPTASKSEPATTAHPLPPNWEGIEIGHLVLALYDPADGEGWWEATVVEKAGDMLTLKWRDEPRQPKFVRHRLTVALLDPNAAAPTAAAPNQPERSAG
jgi:hypothetical protein